MGRAAIHRSRARDEVPPDSRQRVRALASFATKLQVPQLRPGLVRRSALVDRLRTGDPVIAVSAPAGYGKSTLLTQWAAEDDRPFAWLTITPGDNDLTVLAAYVALALDSVDPLAPEELAAFASPGTDGPTVLLPRLGRVLYERRGPFVLVIDDVHLLTDPDCLNALDVLVSHLPAGCQLALSSRHDAPLARPRLRTRRTLMEVRTDDLALSPSEGRAALADAGLELDPPTADSLVKRTEGWPAGIYLAALALRDLPDAADAAERFTGDNRLVAEFLRDELIAGLPDDIIEFLTRTSVLEYLDGPGCDAVLDRTDSLALLEELAHSNLFVVPLDASWEQFRYHHLFGDLLRLELRRREPELLRVLHGRASMLFADRGHPNLAIEHARLAGDVDRAVALVWQNAPPYLGSGRGATVARWLTLFTPGEVSTHPALALATAWCCVTARETRPVSEWIDLARRGDTTEPLPDGTPLASAVALLEAVTAEHGLTQMVESAARAFELDRPDSPFRAAAAYWEGTGHLLLGHRELARERLEEALRLAVLIPAATTSSLAQLALLEIGDDEWTEAERLSERAVALNREVGITEQAAQSMVFAVSALVHAHRGDTIGARRAANHARRLLSILNYLGGWTLVETRIILARVDFLLGDIEAARLLVQEADELLARLPDMGILPDWLAELASTIAGATQAVALSAAPLTTAELRVLAYLPTHLSFQAMAEDLFVSRNTVKTQAIAVYRKLGVSSRGDAVARARELGLLGG